MVVGAVSQINQINPQNYKLCENTNPATSFKSEEKQRSLTAKKWGVGIASFLQSGLGQLINGQVSKGFSFLGLSIANALLCGLIVSKTKNNKLLVINAVAALVIKFFSVVDAVKNVKPDKQ